MTVLDERRPAFTWGAQDPTAMDRLPEVVWDDDATREHPGLVAELEALYGLEYTKPAPRPALPRRAELRNTPPNGIPLKTKRAKRPEAAPAVPATGDSARQRLMRTRSTKALVMAAFLAADTYAAVALAGPPAALTDVFSSDNVASADASVLSSSTVLAASSERAASALEVRDATVRADRSLVRTDESKALAAVSQLTAAADREKAAAEAAAKAKADALSDARSNPQALAKLMAADRGWGSSQFSCLSKLWHKESGWNYKASNPSSGAYGIPQSLPGSKMASAGSDWRTNPVTQIKWGLDYIADRYGSPCSAWGHSQSVGWY